MSVACDGLGGFIADHSDEHIIRMHRVGPIKFRMTYNKRVIRLFIQEIIQTKRLRVAALAVDDLTDTYTDNQEET